VTVTLLASSDGLVRLQKLGKAMRATAQQRRRRG